MITIPHKGGIISKKDENKIPEVFFGRHSNGIEWIYFETTEEKEQFYADNFPPQPIEEIKEETPLLQALKKATPEELAELKTLLNS